MNLKWTILRVVPTTLLILFFIGCGPSQQFAAVPKDLDRSKVFTQSVEIKAKHFDFIPSEIRVKAGTLVRLSITSIDGTHGFRLAEFGIDERLDENETKTIEIFLPTQGEYSFRCSHFCGLGHFGMKGKIVVE